ncbi:UPF0280 family protein [Desulfovibrio aminophilus]|nr:UPF0280 family protein [Desulfovibrio aminophilus]
MKDYTRVGRDYRESVAPDAGERAFQVVIEESDLFVVARRDLSAGIADFLRGLRGELKSHILLRRDFLPSLTPLPAPAGAPEIARRMYEAARACDVGPMAAVAGTVAQMVCERFVSESPDIIVENGGDIFLCSTRERVVGLLAEPESGTRLGLRIPAGEFPTSLCSSSGRIGHSLSLGRGDLVTVRADSGALADAAATALCNRLKTARDLEAVLAGARELAPAGVLGVFAQMGGQVAAWGRVELVAL